MREIIYIHLPTFHLKMQIQAEPDLAGKPLILEEHGFVKAASPEALMVGILPGSRANAARHYLGLESRPYNPEYSRKGATVFWEILSRFSPLVEPDSFDGAFVDLTGCGNASALAAKLAATIWDTLGLISNIGRAQNKFLAKIAAAEASSYRQRYRFSSFIKAIYPGSERSFLAGLPVSTLWPLDAKITRKLTSLGLYTIGEVAEVPLDKLFKEFGADAQRLADLCRGVDPEPVRALYPPPQIVYRHNFLEGCTDKEPLISVLKQLAAKVAAALDRSVRQARCLTLLLATEDGEIEQERWLRNPTANSSALAYKAIDLLNACLITSPIYEVSLCAGELQLAIGEQLGFFAELAKVEKEQTMDELLLSIKDRFGLDSIDLAKAYTPPRRELILSRYYH